METEKRKNAVCTLAALYVAAIYGCIIAFFCLIGGDTPATAANMLVLCLPFGLALISRFYIKKNRDRISRITLLYSGILVKYLLIPMYIAGGGLIALLLLLIFTPVVIMIFVSPILIAVLCFFGWIYMVGGDIFSLAYINKAREEGVHGKGLCTLAKVCQFFFAADVISMMVLALKERKCIIPTAILALLFLFGFLGVLLFIVAMVLSNS